MHTKDKLPANVSRARRHAKAAAQRKLNTWMLGLQKAMFWKKNHSNLFQHSH